MTVRRVDVRFALPEAPRTASTFGALKEFRAGLAAAGIAADGVGTTDLAVAAADQVAAAIAVGAPSIVVEGVDVARLLRRAGYRTRVVLPMPSLELPELLLPLGDVHAARRLLSTWRQPTGWLGRARYLIALSTAATGAASRLRPVFTVGTRLPGPPFPIAAAAPIGVPADASWFLASPGVDSQSRVVFVLASRGSARAEWALKVSRSRGPVAAFGTEQAALALVATTGQQLARHAPALLGRFTAHEHECSVESAAQGERLATLLPRQGSAGLPLVESIAAWIVALGTATAGPRGSAAPELNRLEADVLPRWAVAFDRSSLDADTRGVLAHHDLGCWNIVAAGDLFTALDWESARPNALPLWDLAYFLVHALPLLDGSMNEIDPAGPMLELLRGRTPMSAVFFDWLRRGADSLGIGYDAVPAIVTLCWLHHGLSHINRGVLGPTTEGQRATFVPPVERIAPGWINDPQLGTSWPAWHAATRPGRLPGGGASAGH